METSFLCKQWSCFQPRQREILISHDLLPNPKQQMPLKCTKEQGAYWIGDDSCSFLVKGREGIKRSVLCYFGASKGKMALGQVNPPSRGLLRAAEGEWFYIFMAKGYVFLFSKGLAPGGIWNVLVPEWTPEKPHCYPTWSESAHSFLVVNHPPPHSPIPESTPSAFQRHSCNN